MKEIQPEAGLRAVLVGCGAIALTQAQAFLAEGVSFQAFVDPVRERAEGLARSLGIGPSISAQLSPAAIAGADFAVVCSPPWEHARQCIQLLEAGVDVLCEKPLAVTADDVKATMATAQRMGRVLGVAMVRRFMGQSETLKEIVASQLLGPPRAVRVRESMFGWPLSKGMLESAGQPVGTLADSGTHALDLIQWVFGHLALESYEDNAKVGEESFCHLTGRAGETAIELFLMRRVAVAPRWTIQFERGRVMFSPRTAGQLEIHVPGVGDPLIANRPQEPFCLQARNFLSAVHRRAPLRASLEDCEGMASFIDACHRRRTPRAPHVIDSPQAATTLVSGGTGNIGSRLAEILADRGDLGRYRFLIRNFDNAADLCRLGATIAVADLSTGEALHESLLGCTKILHLGAGAEPGLETRNLALAARRAGVSRFVHFSTANVFGMDLDPQIEHLQEATPLRGTGDTYCDGKAGAEKVLEKFKDLNPVILRPHVVYGPGMRWTFDLANQLEMGRLAVLDRTGVANLIFVDDLVECALAMLETSVAGAYFVTDNAPTPWSEYIDAHAQRLSYPLPPRCQGAPRSSSGGLNALGASGRALWRVVASDSFREFLTEDPLVRSTLFRLYLQTRDTGLMKKAKDSLQQARSAGPAIAASPQWLTLQTSQARLSSANLHAATGFKAAWSFERGIETSIGWLRGRGY